MKECMHVAWLILWLMLGCTIHVGPPTAPHPPIPSVIVREGNELRGGIEGQGVQKSPGPGGRADPTHQGWPGEASISCCTSKLAQAPSTKPDTVLVPPTAGPRQASLTSWVFLWCWKWCPLRWGKELSPWSHTDLASKPCSSMTSDKLLHFSCSSSFFFWL